MLNFKILKHLTFWRNKMQVMKNINDIKEDRVGYTSVSFGADPEFFFLTGKIRKRVVGAELVLPKDGLKDQGLYWSPKVFIIDGVQAEMNPLQNTCRANFANNMRTSFNVLKKHLDSLDKKYEVSFRRAVKISKSELAKLQPENQVFGCTPSFNVYKEPQGLLSSVNPLEYRVRTAGGHIHIGHSSQPVLEKAFKNDLDTFIKVLDIIVGNTCVLLDREEGNAERRKLYGRAGEYRLPKHGVEYRTLSNFWMTHTRLMSIVMGLIRFSVSIMYTKHQDHQRYSRPENPIDFTPALFSLVDFDDIKKAINENNYDLALSNYKKILPFLEKTLPTSKGECGRFALTANNLPEFEHFFTMIKEKGLSYWFKEDPFTHWCNIPDAHNLGGGDFLNDQVHKDMVKHTKKA